MKSKAFWITAMVLLVVTAACGSKEFPTGAYKPAQPSSTDRIVEFEFAEDGTFTISYYNDLKVVGTYATSGNNITLNESEDGPCFGSPVIMSWTSSGNNLTLKSVEDTCVQAPSFDWAREWIREP
jgi:hypothetical protein